MAASLIIERRGRTHGLRSATLGHAPDNGGTDEPAITRNFTKTRAAKGEIPGYVRNLGHALLRNRFSFQTLNQIGRDEVSPLLGFLDVR